MKVGDRVIIQSVEKKFMRQWIDCAAGGIGTIVQIAEEWFWVEFPNGYRNNYGESHLELADPAPLSALEYEEIMTAQELMELLGK